MNKQLTRTSITGIALLSLNNLIILQFIHQYAKLEVLNNFHKIFRNEAHECIHIDIFKQCYLNNDYLMTKLLNHWTKC